jgi:hypothetical protein
LINFLFLSTTERISYYLDTARSSNGLPYAMRSKKLTSWNMPESGIYEKIKDTSPEKCK